METVKEAEVPLIDSPEPQAPPIQDVTVYRELLAALEGAKNLFDQPFSPFTPTESREDYLTRLARAIGQISDTAWEALSQDAQTWVNNMVAVINSASRVIPDCPGFVYTGLVKSNTTIKVDKPKAKPGKTTPLEIPAEMPDKRQLRGVTESVREIVIAHLNYSGDQIRAEMVKQGWDESALKMGSITTVRADTLAVMRIATRLGWAKVND